VRRGTDQSEAGDSLRTVLVKKAVEQILERQGRRKRFWGRLRLRLWLQLRLSLSLRLRPRLLRLLMRLPRPLLRQCETMWGIIGLGCDREVLSGAATWAVEGDSLVPSRWRHLDLQIGSTPSTHGSHDTGRNGKLSPSHHLSSYKRLYILHGRRRCKRARLREQRPPRRCRWKLRCRFFACSAGQVGISDDV